MQAINKQDWQSLPEQGQKEIYEFFLSIKQRYASKPHQEPSEQSETNALSNHSANSISEWHDKVEDDVWK